MLLETKEASELERLVRRLWTEFSKIQFMGEWFASLFSTRSYHYHIRKR